MNPMHIVYAALGLAAAVVLACLGLFAAALLEPRLKRLRRMRRNARAVRHLSKVDLDRFAAGLEASGFQKAVSSSPSFIADPEDDPDLSRAVAGIEESERRVGTALDGMKGAVGRTKAENAKSEALLKAAGASLARAAAEFAAQEVHALKAEAQRNQRNVTK